MPTDRRTVARPLPKCQSVRPPVFGVSPEFPPQHCGAGLSPVSERRGVLCLPPYLDLQRVFVIRIKIKSWMIQIAPIMTNRLILLKHGYKFMMKPFLQVEDF